MFDNSSYLKGNIHGIIRMNAKLPLKLKDETNGNINCKIICLSPKLYMILLETLESIKRAKGAQKEILDKKINYDHYKNSFENHKPITNKQSFITSKSHTLYTI